MILLKFVSATKQYFNRIKIQTFLVQLSIFRKKVLYQKTNDGETCH
jgi:hypothetical protein